jgi:putative radical SAM enzyme (TIGR03279 family)
MPTSVDSYPEVVSVEPGSAAERAGVQVGDLIVSVNGVVPRDILEWMRLVDDSAAELHVIRGREDMHLDVSRLAGEPLGAGISSAVFDRVQTCDNHCEFCFIYQLPKGMRRSLYLKDDDYRLSFLFGNFTTLTRFTEADAERVLGENLSPLHVSIHAASPRVRSEMLRNDRGGFSLRWARFLLDHGISVKAQIVLCPDVNDRDVLDDTFARLLEEMPELESIAVVPLGLSRHNTEKRMRIHTSVEADQAVEQVERWAALWTEMTGRRVVHAADELYLVAGREVPESAAYGDYTMLEDGIGLIRSFLDEFAGRAAVEHERDKGFFGNVDSTGYVRAANPAVETGLRRQVNSVPVQITRSALPRAVSIVTGEYAAPVIENALAAEGFDDVEVVPVRNRHFGGNTAVAGLMTGRDIQDALQERDRNRTYVLPDVCLNEGRLLDDTLIEELSSSHDVIVIPSDGRSLRHFLDSRRGQAHRG